jgi:hypothetical protein
MLIVIVVGFFVGALTGLVVGAVTANGVVIALVSGVVAVVAAGVARNVILPRRPAVAPTDIWVPPSVLVFAAVASVAGSLAGYVVATSTGMAYSWGIGAAAGLFSAVLMALLILVYVMDPNSSQSRMRGM